MADIDREIAFENLGLARGNFAAGAMNLDINIKIHDLTILILEENLKHSESSAQIIKLLHEILNELKER